MLSSREIAKLALEPGNPRIFEGENVAKFWLFHEDKLKI